MRIPEVTDLRISEDGAFADITSMIGTFRIEMRNVASLVDRTEYRANDVPHRVARAYEDIGIIAAIKLARELTGSGLKEAKEYVERLAKRENLKKGRGTYAP